MDNSILEARAAFFEKIKKAAHDGTFPSLQYDEDKGWVRCKYRFFDDNGKEHRCLAGLLLDRGDPIQEGEPVNGTTMNKVFNKYAEKMGIQLDDLYKLQCIHDRWAREGWNAEGFLDDVKSTGLFDTELPLATERG